VITLFSLALEAAERGLIADSFARRAIRYLCGERLRALELAGASVNPTDDLLETLAKGPIAVHTEKANEQHYELPPEFFGLILGPRRKYSCCYWSSDARDLAAAEEAALVITCERAGLTDGQDVLDLGCGWGALSLWVAEHYPHSRITAVSNSRAQKRHIDSELKRLGLANVRTITADINAFDPGRHEDGRSRFDRVVSIEMFEHLHNYQLMLERIATSLRPDGRLFVHTFCHRRHAYVFESQGAANWMGRHFFTGGIMPSADLLHHFDRHLQVTQDWTWDGTHYRRTAEAWLENFDAHEPALMQILRTAYGPAHARRWFHRWRLFFLAVAELFGFRGGSEWYVVHSLLAPKTNDMSEAR
jgi:cyclopropane-fatty-acyl-phospholipid synthase